MFVFIFDVCILYGLPGTFIFVCAVRKPLNCIQIRDIKIKCNTKLFVSEFISVKVQKGYDQRIPNTNKHTLYFKSKNK